MIVQALHEIQHEHRYLPAEALQELARRLNVPLHRIHEVASFYPHYRLQPPPAVDVKVCRDMACHLRGAEQLRRGLAAQANEMGGEPPRAVVGGASCLGQCDHAPAVSINDRVYHGKTEELLRDLMKLAATTDKALPRQRADRSPPGWKIDPYGGQRRYDALKKFLEKRDADGAHQRAQGRRPARHGRSGLSHAPEMVRRPRRPRRREIRRLQRRRERAGDVQGPRAAAAHAAPGHRRDDPGRARYGRRHGAASTSGTSTRRRSTRFGRPSPRPRPRAFAAPNVLGSGLAFPLEVFVSPGGYIRGEESALLEAMEDRRGEPRNKPPFPDDQRPVQQADRHQQRRDARLGAGDRDARRRVVPRPGDQRRHRPAVRLDQRRREPAPGVYEVPFGQTVRDLCLRARPAACATGRSSRRSPRRVRRAASSRRRDQGANCCREKFAQGAPGARRRGLRHSRPAAGLEHGRRDGRDARGGVRGLRRPRRHGRPGPELRASSTATSRAASASPAGSARRSWSRCSVSLRAKALRREELAVIGELADAMAITSICGLGQVAANPITSVVKYFPEELDRYLGRAK